MAPLEVFANVASTVVSTGGTTAPSSGAAESWSVVSSAGFPAVTQGATQFHVADPALPGEIIAVTKVAGASWTVTRGAEGTTPVAHASGFTAAQVVPASALAAMQYYAWQFPVEIYGAVGDGRVLGDVVTNGTTTITSASAGFVNAAAPAGDVGKHIMIHGANGSTSGPLITTISSVTNATTVVLAAAPTGSVSNCPAVYGTDDTAAINSALSAAKTYATGHGYTAEITFADKVYVIAAAPTQQTTPVLYNTQLLIPYPDTADTSQKLIITLKGAGDCGYLQFWNSLVPNLSGTALVTMQNPSTATVNGNKSTFGVQSVVGGPSSATGFTGSPGRANTKLIVRGIGVWCPVYGNMVAFDGGYLSSMWAEHSGAHVFAPPGSNASAVQPWLNQISATGLTSSVSVGWRFPVSGNNADVGAFDITAEGYEIAYALWDHFDGQKLNAIYNDVTVKNDGSEGADPNHMIRISSITAEEYNGGLLTTGGSVQVDIDWDAECSGPSYDIHDGGTLHGVFRFRDPAGARFPVVVNGVPNLKVICEELGPGPWSGAPAAPLNAAAQQNTAWRDATVYAKATTSITSTAQGTASTGLTTTGLAGGANVVVPIRVPSGQWYSVTYTGTLTTTWVLD